MPFDYAGAKAAGYSDKEIQEYLSKSGRDKEVGGASSIGNDQPQQPQQPQQNWLQKTGQGMAERAMSPSILNSNDLTYMMKILGINPSAYTSAIGSALPVPRGVGASLGAMIGKGIEEVDTQTREFVGPQGFNNIKTLLQDPNLGENLKQELQTAPERLKGYAGSTAVAGATAGATDVAFKTAFDLLGKLMGPLKTKLLGIKGVQKAGDYGKDLWQKTIQPILDKTTKSGAASNVDDVLAKLANKKAGILGQWAGKTNVPAEIMDQLDSIQGVIDDITSLAKQDIVGGMTLDPNSAEDLSKLFSGPRVFSRSTGAVKTPGTPGSDAANVSSRIAGGEIKESLYKLLENNGYENIRDLFGQYGQASGLSRLTRNPIQGVMAPSVMGNVMQNLGFPGAKKLGAILAAYAAPAGRQVLRTAGAIPYGASSIYGEAPVQVLMQQLLNSFSKPEEQFKY